MQLMERMRTCDSVFNATATTELPTRLQPLLHVLGVNIRVGLTNIFGVQAVVTM